MALTQYENLTTGDDNQGQAYDVYWLAQTFTPSVAHGIERVLIKCFKDGAPGNMAISIQATTSNVPNGSEIASGTLLQTDVGTTAAWETIDLSSTGLLSASTKYAIVIHSTGDSSNRYWWSMDSTSPAYAGGSYISSSNSGTNWSADTDKDFMFEEWGYPSSAAYTLAVTVGAFTLTGIATVFSKAMKMAVTVSSFALTGIAVGLNKGIRMVAVTTSFALTGIDVAFRKAMKMAAVVGAFTLTGIDIAFSKAIKMATAVGSFILTGFTTLFTKKGWDNATKHNSTTTNLSKNSASATNTSKNNSSVTNISKS